MRLQETEAAPETVGTLVNRHSYGVLSLGWLSATGRAQKVMPKLRPTDSILGQKNIASGLPGDANDISLRCFSVRHRRDQRNEQNYIRFVGPKQAGIQSARFTVNRESGTDSTHLRRNLCLPLFGGQQYRLLVKRISMNTRGSQMHLLQPVTTLPGTNFRGN